MTTAIRKARRIPRWTLADRLRKIRRDEGLSQVQFAAKINRGEKAYAAWESGINSPHDIVEVAEAIESTFGVPAAWTLGLSTIPTAPGQEPAGKRRPVIPDPVAA